MKIRLQGFINRGQRAVAFFFFLFVVLAPIWAQEFQPPNLEFAFEVRANIDTAMELGETPHGKRIIIPITGGTLEGPGIKGTILPGGADFQYVAMEGQRTELEAIYTIKTDDNVLLHVRNKGLLYIPRFSKEGAVSPEANVYFRTAPKFEAPMDSKYDWLNNAIFICKPEGKKDYISLQVWKVL